MRRRQSRRVAASDRAGKASGYLRNKVTGDKVRFPADRCLPYPREEILEQRNPSCDLRTYTGGLVSCHHGWHLLDEDQECVHAPPRPRAARAKEAPPAPTPPRRAPLLLRVLLARSQQPPGTPQSLYHLRPHPTPRHPAPPPPRAARHLHRARSIPWADQPLVYYKKFRIYFQPYNASLHKQVQRQDWGIAADGDRSEYDVEQCAAGTPEPQCRKTISGTWMPVPAGGEPKCARPSHRCADLALISADAHRRPSARPLLTAIASRCRPGDGGPSHPRRQAPAGRARPLPRAHVPQDGDVEQRHGQAALPAADPLYAAPSP